MKQEYQREGIGNKLIEHAKDTYKELTLDVYAKNEKALNFYYKNHFKGVESKINEETMELEYKLAFTKGVVFRKNTV